MNKRNLTLIVLLLIVSAAAIYLFKDWFKPEPIHIAYMVRPANMAKKPVAPDRFAPSGKPGFNVTFSLNQDVRLTAVRVYPLAEVQTNQYPQPIWNMVSESNSPPLKSFVYGGKIRGLHPSVKGAVADPLAPGQSYRLVIETKDQKAERDFQMPR
jgi:hypothetical protein